MTDQPQDGPVRAVADTPPDIAAMLRAWRRERGLSQKEIAGKLGVPLRTYEEWEQGRSKPPHPRLLALALQAIG